MRPENNDKYVPLCCFGSGSLAKHEKEKADTLGNRQNPYAGAKRGQNRIVLVDRNGLEHVSGDHPQVVEASCWHGRIRSVGEMKHLGSP